MRNSRSGRFPPRVELEGLRNRSGGEEAPAPEAASILAEWIMEDVSAVAEVFATDPVQLLADALEKLAGDVPVAASGDATGSTDGRGAQRDGA